MIRDPSDGSVREEPSKVKAPQKQVMTSGLPISKENLKEIERLGKSREWIREYFKKREKA